MSKQYTKQDCIEALKEAAEKVDKSLSQKDYESMNISPSAHTIRNRLGGWNKAKEIAGLKVVEGGPGNIPSPPDNVNFSYKEWEKLSMNERKHRRRYSKLADIKMSAGCDNCGYDKHPAALSFHHINPENKSFNIAQNGCKQWDKVSSEIDKCEVLCRNCHQIETQDMSYLNL